MQTTGSDLLYLDRVLDALQNATKINYAAYQVMLLSFPLPNNS